jgi:23S rRNA (uracil1939-C5)-methyltransferase
VKAADIKAGTRCIDAYCGTGTIGMICAKNGAEVVGVELNKSACADAKINARLNGLDNITFVNGDATRFITALAEEGESCDLLILDPPRAGSTEEFIKSAAKLKPDRIVYVSCKIETLERDLKLFVRQGYKAVFIKPVDMFPHTTGIETVVLLEYVKK